MEKKPPEAQSRRADLLALRMPGIQFRKQNLENRIAS